MTTPARKTTRKAPAKRTSGATIPASAPVPQDHKSPAQREAEGIATVAVEWRELTFELPSDPDSWNYWEILEPLAAGNLPVAIRGLIGDAGMLRMRSKYPGLSAADVRELWGAITEKLGVGNLGNL